MDERIVGPFADLNGHTGPVNPERDALRGAHVLERGFRTEGEQPDGSFEEDDARLGSPDRAFQCNRRTGLLVIGRGR